MQNNNIRTTFKNNIGTLVNPLNPLVKSYESCLTVPRSSRRDRKLDDGTDPFLGLNGSSVLLIVVVNWMFIS